MSSGGPEMHKSMIDGEERPGVDPKGRFESNPDEHPATFDENNLDKQKSNTGNSSTGTGTGGNDASSVTRQASNTGGDTDRKPAGGVETGGSAKPQTGGEIQQGQNTNPMSNSNEPNQGFGGAGAQPSVGADVSQEGKTERGMQGGNAPMDDPDNQDDKGGKDESKDKKSGGEPKPLGSGGKAGGDQGTGPGGMKIPEDQGKKEGTGEKWEKSTGMAADGGDFDATRPGAGREADRLMEEKGITRTAEKPKVDEDDAPKRYGVDHSGFGGHGSHQNTTRKQSKDAVPADDASADVSATSAPSDKTEGPAHTDKTIPGSDPGKKGVLEKVKEKIHLGHEKQ